MGGKNWTVEDDQRLVKGYPDTPTYKLAKEHQCTVRAIYKRAGKLGLKKSEKYMSLSRLTRLRPGASKGGSKKGQPSHNSKAIGTRIITKGGYLERKISNTGNVHKDWKREHVIIWEEHNGPAPSGHVVTFRDGNKRNIELGNLELISRAELLKRNSVHCYPNELIQAMRAIKSFNKQLRESHEK